MARGTTRLSGFKRFFTSHYAMERFSFIFLILLILFVVVVVWCGIWLYNSQQAEYRSTSVFEASAVGSESGVKMTPEMLAINGRNGTRAALLVQFDKPSEIPQRAQDYELHITGIDNSGNKREIKNPMKGSFYLYGNSGYGVIYLVCDAGFSDEQLYVTLEATKGVKSSETISDRFALTINPGHQDNVMTADSLNDGFDPILFYRETVLSDTEEKIRKNLDADLSAMQKSLGSMDEYLTRLSDDGIQTKDVLPVAANGDTVSEDKSGNLKLNTDFMFDGGFDFDWRSTSLASNGSYFGLDRSIRVAYDKLAKASSSTSSSTPSSRQSTSSDTFKKNTVFGAWHMEDGRLVEDVIASSSSAKAAQMEESIKLMESATQAYETVKFTYQTQHLKELLDLEESADSMAELITAHEDCLGVY